MSDYYNNDDDKNNRNDLVGYCRPPQHTRFKKGKSGNPAGRPKQEIKGLSKRLHDAMAREVDVELNGEKQKMLMEEIIANTLVKKAAKGDLKSVELIHKLQPQDTSKAPQKILISWED